MLGNSGAAKQLAASQEGLRSIGLLALSLSSLLLLLLLSQLVLSFFAVIIIIVTNAVFVVVAARIDSYCCSNCPDL
jgi:hypothetical protein